MWVAPWVAGALACAWAEAAHATIAARQRQEAATAIQRANKRSIVQGTRLPPAALAAHPTFNWTLTEPEMFPDDD
jgi:hypothetical protein